MSTDTQSFWRSHEELLQKSQGSNFEQAIISRNLPEVTHFLKTSNRVTIIRAIASLRQEARDIVYHFLRKNKKKSTLKKLLRKIVNPHGDNLLHMTLLMEDNDKTFAKKKTALFLISLKCFDLTHKNVRGTSTLHYAAMHADLETFKIVLQKSNKHDLNTQNDLGWTPLIAAILCDREDIVCFLLEECRTNISLEAKYEGKNIYDFVIEKKSVPVCEKLRCFLPEYTRLESAKKAAIDDIINSQNSMTMKM